MVSISLLAHRENNFLKMFKFISGSVVPVVWGQILAQIFFLLVNITVFTGITSLLFKPHLTFQLLGVPFLTTPKGKNIVKLIIGVDFNHPCYQNNK